MKSFGFIVVALVVFLFSGSVEAQRRPVKKPVTVVATPTTTPQPKPTTKAVSPAEAFYNEGLKCDAKDFDCQVSNYTKAINLQLNTKAVFQKRAAAFMGREDFEKAIDDLTKVIELDLNDATGFKDRGKAYMGMALNPQSIRNAVKDFSSAIDLEPKDKEGYRLRADAYFQSGNVEKGNIDLSTAIRLDPGNIDLLLTQARLFSSIEEFDKALSAFTAVIAREPSNSAAFLGRAEVFTIQKKYDLARRDYKLAATQNPKDGVPHIKLAELLLIAKDEEGAINEYSKAIEVAPNDYANYLQRSLLMKKRGKYDEALVDASRAIELFPTNAKGYELRCGLNKDLMNWRRAVEDCSIAASFDPDLSDAYLMRHDIIARLYTTYNNSGKYVANENPEIEQIIKESFLSKARGWKNSRINAGLRVRQSPSVDTFNELASAETLIHAEVYYNLAVANFSKALEYDPSSAQAFAGRCDARQGLYYFSGVGLNYNKGLKLLALQDCQKALSLDPRNETAHRVLKAMGESSPAVEPEIAKLRIDVLDAMIEKNPDFLSLLVLRAKQRKELVDHQANLEGKYNTPAVSKAGRRLREANWNGMPRGIEADLKKAIELFSASQKRDVDREALSQAVQTLSFWVKYYSNSDGDAVGATRVFDDAIAKYPEIYELYKLKCQAGYGCNNEAELGAKIKSEMKKEILDLGVVIREANLRASSLLSQKPIENVSAKSDLNYIIRQREVRRVEMEDAAAQNQTAVYVAQLKQESQRLEQEIADQERQRKEAKARRNAETMNALGGLITTVVQTVAKSNSSSPAVATPERPTTTTSTTNPLSGNGSSGGQTSSGTRGANHAHIYDVSIDTSVNDKCSSGNADSGELCWGPWEAVHVPQVQTRAKGPMAWKGTLGDPNKTIYYEWAIQSRNMTNSVVCIDYEFTHGDGKRGNIKSCIVPGGTQEFRGGEALRTSYPTERLSVRASNFELCSNFEKTGASSYRCLAWPDEVQK